MMNHVEKLRDQLKAAQMEIDLEAQRSAKVQARLVRRQRLEVEGIREGESGAAEDEAFVRSMLERLHQESSGTLGHTSGKVSMSSGTLRNMSTFQTPTSSAGRVDIRTPRSRIAR